MRLYFDNRDGMYRLKGMDDAGKIVTFATANNRAGLDKLYKLAWTLDRRPDFTYAPVG